MLKGWTTDKNRWRLEFATCSSVITIRGVRFDDDERPDQEFKRGDEFRESESVKKKK